MPGCEEACMINTPITSTIASNRVAARRSVVVAGRAGGAKTFTTRGYGCDASPVHSARDRLAQFQGSDQPQRCQRQRWCRRQQDQGGPDACPRREGELIRR